MQGRIAANWKNGLQARDEPFRRCSWAARHRQCCSTALGSRASIGGVSSWTRTRRFERMDEEARISLLASPHRVPRRHRRRCVDSIFIVLADVVTVCRDSDSDSSEDSIDRLIQRCLGLGLDRSAHPAFRRCVFPALSAGCWQYHSRLSYLLCFRSRTTNKSSLSALRRRSTNGRATNAATSAWHERQPRGGEVACLVITYICYRI